MDGWIDIWKSSSTGSIISKLLPWQNRQCRKYCRLNVRLSDVIINLAPQARFPRSDTKLGLVSRSLHLLNPISTLFTKNSILDLIRCPGKITSCSNRLGEAKVKSENIHILSSELTKDLSLSLILAQTRVYNLCYRTQFVIQVSTIFTIYRTVFITNH